MDKLKLRYRNNFPAKDTKKTEVEKYFSIEYTYLTTDGSWSSLAFEQSLLHFVRKINEYYIDNIIILYEAIYIDKD